MLLTNLRNLAVLLGMFFFWGFVAASNSILIGFVKAHFVLSQERAQLLDTAFYGAYFYGALLIYLFSYYTRRDLIYHWGYKRALIIGLGISLLGMLGLSLIILQANPSFEVILLPLFIVALGFSLQQVVANPLLLLLGDPQKSAYRLSMAGGLNSLGTMLGPVVLSQLLFKYTLKTELLMQKLPYLYFTLAAFFLVLIFAFSFLKLPSNLQAHKNQVSKGSRLLKNLLLVMAFLVPLIMFSDQILQELAISRLSFYFALLLIFPVLILFSWLWARFNPQLWGVFADSTVPLGMLAIFCYVGVEVSIPSNFNIFFTRENWHSAYLASWDFVEISKSAIVWYWGSLMIGRWIGAIEVLKTRTIYMRYLGYLMVVTLGFAVLYFTHQLSYSSAIAKGELFRTSWVYLCLVWVFASLVFWVRHSVAQLLLLLSVTALTSLIIGILSKGMVAYYALLAVGLSCAMMWPAIFDLVLRDKSSRDAAKISGLMIMMILGGALFSPLQGVVADMQFVGSARMSYWIPALGLGYLLIFAVYFVRRQP